MSCSDRRALLRGLATAAGAALAAGCGFEPLYGTNSAGRRLLGRVAVSAPSDRLGFLLAESMEQRLGTPGPDPVWTLKVGYALDETGLAITEDRAILRYRVDGTATFQLIRIETGSVEIEGAARTQTAYSATASLFATRAARRDAERRAVEDLGRRVVEQVAAAAGSA